jgi:hypothetical protein
VDASSAFRRVSRSRSLSRTRFAAMYSSPPICSAAYRLMIRRRDISVVQPRVALDAAAKLCRIEHDLPDHLKGLALKDMRGDVAIAELLQCLTCVRSCAFSRARWLQRYWA